ncbi:MAG: pilus assembly protein PilP [Gammaproteobacteria bacterium]|nr:pilus assembly protein PilP [Gammaproteobacteria bacterium]
MKASLILRNTALLLASFVFVTGCGAGMDDLDAYILEVKALPGGRIEPLPEITPYEVYTYIADAEGLRSPFTPDSPQASGVAGGPRPDEERIREHLENFSLDTMRMVGTLDFGEDTYGLVQTSDGLIHRVLPGNFMGQNDGRIVSISESEINLVEIISDGIGGYVERDAAVGLSD